MVPLQALKAYVAAATTPCRESVRILVPFVLVIQDVGHRAAAQGGTVGGQGLQAGAVLQEPNTGKRTGR